MRILQLLEIADYFTANKLNSRIEGNKVIVQVPGQLNGKLALFDEMVFSMPTARAIVRAMQ